MCIIKLPRWTIVIELLQTILNSMTCPESVADPRIHGSPADWSRMCAHAVIERGGLATKVNFM